MKKEKEKGGKRRWGEGVGETREEAVEVEMEEEVVTEIW